MQQDRVKKAISELDSAIGSKIGDNVTQDKINLKVKISGKVSLDLFKDDDEYYLKDWEPEGPKFERTEADKKTLGTLYTYIVAHVLVYWEGEMVRAKVGNPI